MTNNIKANSMYEEYKRGLSLAQIGRLFGVTRQSVFETFKARRFELRKKKHLPCQLFDGFKFTPQNNGYFRKSFGDRMLMHRAVWNFHKGDILPFHDIHHKDHDKSNNKIENLEMIKRDEHARKYNNGNNQYNKTNQLK